MNNLSEKEIEEYIKKINNAKIDRDSYLEFTKKNKKEIEEYMTLIVPFEKEYFQDQIMPGIGVIKDDPFKYFKMQELIEEKQKLLIKKMIKDNMPIFTLFLDNIHYVLILSKNKQMIHRFLK